MNKSIELEKGALDDFYNWIGEKERHCYGNLHGLCHKYEVVDHEERWMFWLWSRGYDILECTVCKHRCDRPV